MNRPLVSICMPVYNGAEFLEEALRSVTRQSYTNLELVVSDDDSKDNSLEIVKVFKLNSKVPVKIITHKPAGIGANWNNCIKEAGGKYIKFLFQDDVLEPACIEKMVQVMEADEAVGLVASKRKFIIEESFKTKHYEKWVETYGDLQTGLTFKKEKNMIYLDKSLFSDPCFFVSPLNKIGEPSTFMFKKETIKKIGYFNEELKQVLDYEFCYRILKKQKIVVIEEKLVGFRLHGSQTTVKNKYNNAYTEDFYRLEKIIYKHYRRYLEKKHRKRLLKKYNLFYRVLRKIKTKRT